MNQLTARIETIADELVDSIVEAGPPTDLVAEFAAPLPLLMICEMLGIPYEDRVTFKRHMTVRASQASSVEAYNLAETSMTHYLHELVERRRSSPSHDMISGLIDQPELSEDEVVGILFLVLGAGHATTTNMLTMGTWALISEGQWSLLLSQPSLLENAVEELLRFITTVDSVARVALEDIEFAGHQIREGETVVLCTHAANRDPRQFADPDVLNVRRHDVGHLAFSHGLHQCLAQHLARVELQVGFGALLRRLPNLRMASSQGEIRIAQDGILFGPQEFWTEW